MTTSSVGQATGGKPINLAQLQAELATAGLPVQSGLGLIEAYVSTYDDTGQPVDFPDEAQATVDATITAHIALRHKTSEEYAEEFQNTETTTARKQEIRDVQNGLLPPEQVAITQEEWDRQFETVA